MTEKNDKPGQEAEEQHVEVPRIPLADLLRHARENAGYSIERSAAATRITADFITNLERGQFKTLPGHVFVRGFLKSLAKLYGVPSDTLLAAYEFETGDAKPAPTTAGLASQREHTKATLVPPLDRGRKSKVEAPKDRESERANPMVRKAAIVGGLVVVAIILLIISQRPAHTSDSERAAVQEQAASTKATAPANQPTVIPSTAPAADPNAQATGATTPAGTTDTTAAVSPVDAAATAPVTAAATPGTALAPGMQELKIVAKEKVRVRYKKDGEQWVTAEWTPNNYDQTFRDSFQLMIYDAAAVDVTYNGKNLGSLGGKGRIRRLNFQAADLSKATAKKP